MSEIEKEIVDSAEVKESKNFIEQIIEKDLADLVVGLLAVVTRNTDKFQLGELLHVFKRHFTSQPHLKGFQTLIHGGISLLDRKSTRLNSSHDRQSRMPSSA